MINTLQQLRQTRPLILNLTNVVTMDIVANVLLAIGAAPIMTAAIEELDELIAMSAAISINIGTLNADFIEQCRIAIHLAKIHKVPIVFDPVGAGATRLRSNTAREFMAHAQIIRGNASEIIALTGTTYHTKGVESTNTTEEAIQVAVKLASQYDHTIMISGATDYITDGKHIVPCRDGSSLMSSVTGMGCSLNAVIAAFLSVIKDPFEASRQATTFYGTCGQIAAEKTSSPASFRTQFIDTLYEKSVSSMENTHD